MYARERARHEHAFLALREVRSGCADVGIDVLPVKGVLTAHLFYRDPGERPIRDIDLRVQERDLARVEHVGRRSGWRLLGRSWAYRTLAFEVLGFLVEFESHVGPPGLCGLPVEDMLRRARPSVEPLGLPHLQPEIHDHAVLLCVNAFKDKLVDAVPGAIRDLELLPIQPGFVPDRFVSLAATSGVVTIAWIVANWLVEARRSTGWHGLRERLGRMSPRACYASLFDRLVRSRIPFRQNAPHPRARRLRSPEPPDRSPLRDGRRTGRGHPRQGTTSKCLAGRSHRRRHGPGEEARVGGQRP
jgi:hypothetical protein